MRCLLALGLASILASCAPSPRRIVINSSSNPQLGGSSSTVIQPGGNSTGGTGTTGGTPLEILNQAEQHLTQHGFQRVGPAVRNANMQAGGIVAYAIEASPGQCYVSLAVGTEGTDINLIVIDPQGRQVGHNVLPDARPWVHFCPQTGGRHIARLQMARGQGEYFYALYQGAHGRDPQLAGLLSSGSGTATGQPSVTIDPETQQRLAMLDARLASRQFQRLGPPVGAHKAQGEDINHQLNLRQGFCYAFASLGGPGTLDTDLFIETMEGETIAQDRRTDRDALVEYCPPVTRAYRLRTNLYDGEGPVFVVAYLQQSQTTQPTNPQSVLGAQQASQGIDERLALLDADMQARGYEAYGEIQSGELTQGQNREFDIRLEGGKCYAIVAVGASSVRNLDLTLLDADGHDIDRDTAEDARPVVRVCAEESGTYRMRVQMTEGAGPFRYHAYRWPRGTSGPFGLRGLIYVRLAEVTALLNVEGYEPDTSTAPGRGRLRRQGATSTHNLELPANHCVGILVVGGEGVNDLDVSLQRGRETLATDGTRNPFPTVRFCTTEAGRYRLTVRAANGSGQYFYQVFQRNH